MSAKKQTSWIEAVRNAATGYTAVVLGVTCFLLALIVIMAGVRIVIGLSSSANASATPTNAPVAVDTSGSGAA